MSVRALAIATCALLPACANAIVRPPVLDTPIPRGDKSQPPSFVAPIDPDAAAVRIEKAIQDVGETRPISGAATEPFAFTFELHRPKSDGPFELVLQQADVVHCVAGNMSVGIALYRVGLVGGEPRIVLRGALRSKRYEVVWESWPDGLRRAGSPAPSWIEFEF